MPVGILPTVCLSSEWWVSRVPGLWDMLSVHPAHIHHCGNRGPWMLLTLFREYITEKLAKESACNPLASVGIILTQMSI